MAKDKKNEAGFIFSEPGPILSANYHKYTCLHNKGGKPIQVLPPAKSSVSVKGTVDLWSYILPMDRFTKCIYA